MNDAVIQAVLGVDRVVLYFGFVLLPGTLIFWSLVWPDGRGDRRLVSLAVTGGLLMAVATLADPVLRVVLDEQRLTDVLSPLEGAALLVRLGALAATAFFLTDLVRDTIVGWRRVFAIAIVGALTASLVAQSEWVYERGDVVAIIVVAGHLLAVAAWLGGVVVIATALTGSEDGPEPGWLIDRFSPLAVGCVLVLTVSGIVHAVSVADGFSRLASSYGAVLLVKTAAFAMMLLWGGRGARYAADMVRTRRGSDTTAVGAGTHARTIVTRIELSLAFVVLVATSVAVGMKT